MGLPTAKDVADVVVEAMREIVGFPISPGHLTSKGLAHSYNDGGCGCVPLFQMYYDGKKLAILSSIRGIDSDVRVRRNDIIERVKARLKIEEVYFVLQDEKAPSFLEHYLQNKEHVL